MDGAAPSPGNGQSRSKRAKPPRPEPPTPSDTDPHPPVSTSKPAGIAVASESGRIDAIVVAAGRSERMGVDKLFVALGGRPVLSWSLAALEGAAQIRRVALVISTENLERGQALVQEAGFRKVSFILGGGARRQDSVWNGLVALAGAEWILVQDAARPFVTEEMIGRGIAAAQRVGAAIAAMPVKDTIKFVDSAGFITGTPARSALWAAQTPQIFRYDLLVAAYQQAGSATVTDDAALVEQMGQPVAVFRGSYGNVKITTPEDLVLAESLATCDGSV